MKRTIGTLALCLALAGCGGGADEDDDAAAPRADAPESSEPEAPEPSPAVECEPASDALIKRIEGLAPTNSGLDVLEAQGYRNPDFDNVYFVAARFSATGIGDQNVGVYAVGGGLDGTGTLLAVDNLAQEFYDGPDASETQADISETDPGIDVAKSCLSG